MDKKALSERDICTKYITPAIEKADWKQNQFREEVKLTDGRVKVTGRLASRIKNPDQKGGPKSSSYTKLGKSVCNTVQSRIQLRSASPSVSQKIIFC